MTARASRMSFVLVLAVASACAAPQKKDLSKFVSANPRSIVVVPVVNKTIDVDAADYFLSTLPVPLAERGYYVFPVNLVKRLLEDDGLSDASVVHAADATRIARLFGADAVMLVSIERWDAQYMVISTRVTVEFEYVLKCGRTGEVLWTERRSMVYAPQSTNAGNPLATLIAAAVSAAMTKAAPNYMPLARQANETALAYPGPGFPVGPYRPEYRTDL